MNYSQSLNYLDSFLNLERIDWSNHHRLWNLDRMRYLLELFDHPEKSFFSVIIAGTKGKGSTGFFLESILSQARIRTGFYTSPHLESPRERIRIQGQWISKKDWADVFGQIQKRVSGFGFRVSKQSNFESRNPKLEFTYFEIMTLAAALAFRKKKVKVAIWEVGMGGRLDATNVMGAKLGIITPIHLDHTAILGKTISKIASEKAAVINKNAHIVVARQFDEAKKVIQKQLRKQRAIPYGPQKISTLHLGLSGTYQRQNAGLALRAAQVLTQNFEFLIPKAAIRQGLAQKNWPARFEIVDRNPTVILDGAHNPSSIRALRAEYQKQFANKQGVVLFGTAKDKDASGMLEELAKSFETLFLIQVSGSRAQKVEHLASLARPYFKKIFIFGSNIEEALGQARKIVKKQGVVLVTGSFCVVGEMKRRNRNVELL